MASYPTRQPLFGLDVHPGEILREEFMQPMDLKAAQLAEAMGTSAVNLSRILNGKQSISAEMAVRLSKVFGTSIDFWMNLQSQYDLAALGADKIRQIEASAKPLAA